MSLPREARDGLERAWLAVLSARHPSVAWAIVRPAEPEPDEPEAPGSEA